jgi:hypothetical protein
MARKRKAPKVEDPIEISDDSEDEDEAPKKKRKTTIKKKPATKKSAKDSNNVRNIEISDVDTFWEWQEHYYSGYSRYDQSISEQIEKAYQQNNTGNLIVQINGQNYKIDLSAMQQMNERTHSTKSVRRQVQKTNVRHVNAAHLYELFDKYKEVGKDENSKEEGINGEGIEAFANDAEIDPMDLSLLVLFWRLKCAKQFYISQDEFVYGLARLGMETMDKIKQKLPNIKNTELSDEKAYTDFYNYCFTYSKESEQRTLPLDIAIPTWKLILTKERCPYVDDWCDYMENVNKKAVTFDTWSKLYNIQI